MSTPRSSHPVATDTVPLQVSEKVGVNLSDLTWTRWMLWGNVVGAGAMAVSTLIAPTATASLLDLDGDPLLWRLVGSMWLGFAVASGIGLRQPIRYRAIMVAQIAYKTMFVALAAAAAVSNPGLAMLAVIFVMLVAGYGYALWTSSDRST